MGLLAVDVSAYGVAMSADSQLVEIRPGENRVLDPGGSRSRNPIVIRSGGGFVGLVGFAGTEEVEGKSTADWVTQFSAAWPSDDVGTFCDRLAATLTEVWQRDRLESVLEILVTGEVNGDVQFWFVRNSDGLLEGTWMHGPLRKSFWARNDLDASDGYVATARANPDLGLAGASKDQVLERVTFSFWQGVLVPASAVFQGFRDILNAMYQGGVPGCIAVTSRAMRRRPLRRDDCCCAR